MLVEKTAPEAPGSVFDDPEPGFDKRAGSPGLALVVAVEEFERPVAPGTALSPNQRATAVPLQYLSEIQQGIEARSARRHFDSEHFKGIRIDRSPAGTPLAVDLEFRLVDGYLSTTSSLRLKQMPKTMEPLSDRSTNGSIRR